MRNPKLVPYETIVKATSGEPEAVDEVLRHYNKQIRSLADAGLEISGMTPDLTTEEIRRTKKFSRVKADEILLWLKMHQEVKGWVVLDDLALHKEAVTRHQVKPDHEIGLTAENIREAERILMAG